MKVRELIEKLQTLEDQEMEVVAIDHEYGAYRLHDPEIREEYAAGYTKARVVVLDDNYDSLHDLDEKYLIKEEPPKRSANSSFFHSLVAKEYQQIISDSLERGTVFLVNKDNLPKDGFVEFKVHDERKDSGT